jgi:DNA-binding NtrC family response regulator/tetratricopeptide (TPR) repeat protein
MTDRPEWSEEPYSGEGPGSPFPAYTDFTTDEEIGDMHFSTENFTLAREYYEKALRQIGERGSPSAWGRLFRKISDCYIHKGHNQEASRYLEKALELLPAGTSGLERAKLECRRGYLFFHEGDYQEGLTRGFEAYRVLKKTDEHSEVAKTQLLLANCYHRLGDLGEAEQFYMDALASYRRVNDEAGISFVYNNLGLMHKNACRWSQAISHLNKALELCNKLGLGQHTVRVNQNLGVVYYKMRDFVQAVSCSERARRKAKSMGDDERLAIVTLHLGRVYLAEGRLEKAERCMLEGQVLAEKFNFKRQLALSAEFFGDLMRARGRIEEAEQNYEAGLVRAREIAPEGDIVAELLRRMAELELDKGAPKKALATARKALRVSFACGESHEVGFILRVMGCAYARLGERSKAERTFRNSVGEFVERNLPYESAWTSVIAAETFLESDAREDRLKAKQLCGSAVTEFQKADEGQGLIRVYRALARSEKELGNFDEALLATIEAERVAEEYRDEAELARLQELRRDVEEALASSHRVEEQFSFLGSLGELSSSGDSLRDGLQKLVRSVIEKTGSARGLLAVFDEDGGLAAHVAVKMARGEVRRLCDWYRGRSLSSEEGTGGLILTDSSQSRSLPLKRPGGSVICQPLSLGGEELGFFLLHKPEGEPLGQEALKVLTTYSGLVSLSLQERFRRGLRVGEKVRRLEPRSPESFRDIITENRQMLDLLDLAEKVARSNATVLLSGETGTGKGLIAYAVHLLSNRRDRRFIPVNCAALPDQLLESELFGYVKGSFTGAGSDRRGLVEEADGGTLFLDEVGKTSLAMQGKLLQFLDRMEVRPVGSTAFRPVDVRVICASKVDLLALCEEGRFLEDLYYRINDFPLPVPPLRQRAGDVELLIDHYLTRFTQEMGKIVKGVSRDAVAAMKRYSWPGNIRELEKVVKRAVILADEGAEVTADLLPAEIRSKKGAEAPAGGGMRLKEKLARVEASMIEEALERSGWNRTRAARELGISYPSLLQKIKVYGLSPAD